MEGLKKGILIHNNVAVGAVGDKYFSTCPLGTVLSYAGNIIPRGFLVCDGASYKVADYPDLYAVIGNTYGGDSTNFNVPNLVDKFVQGSTTSGTEKEAGLPNITGGWMPSVPVGYQNYATGAVVAEVKSSGLVSLAGTQAAIGAGFKIDASKSSAVYGNSTTVQPPALTMVYIIKAFHTNEGVDSGVSDVVINYINNSTKVDVVLYDVFDIKVDNIQNRLYLLGNILYGSLYLRFDEEHNPLIIQELGWVDIGDVPQIVDAPQLYNCISYADTEVGNDYAQGDVRVYEGKLQVRIKKQPTVSRNNWYVFYQAVCMKVKLAE